MQNIRITKKNYQEEFNKKWGNKYEIVEGQEYTRNDKLMKFKCKICGNIFETTIRNLLVDKKTKKDDIKCPECRRRYKENNLENLMVEWFGRNPYEFLSEYKDVHTPMKVKCKDCGNIFNVKLFNIQLRYKKNLKLGLNHHYCKTCSFKELGKNKIKPFEYELNRLNEMNNGKIEYEFLSEYIGYEDKMKVKCLRCGDILSVSIGNLIYASSKGIHYCPQCNNMKRYNTSYEEKIKITSPNIINLEPYGKRQEKVRVQCKVCGYTWMQCPGNLLAGNGCPKCSRRLGNSIIEEEIEKILKVNNIKYKRRATGIISGRYELDFYFKDLNLAIECDGVRWHSDKYKDKNYHLMKTKLCEEKGIRLIHIFETEWKKNKDICIDKIKNILHIENNFSKFYARWGYIEEIKDNKEKIKFLNKNHIQGNSQSSINLGLYGDFEDENGNIKIHELLAVMTFCKPRSSLGHKESNYDYELARYTTLRNFIVIGGFSKLLKYFERNYEWNKIITYADRRWSMGNVYLKNGFKLIRETKPNYWYYDRNKHKLFHRYSFRKDAIKKKFPNIYDESLTEFQMMDKLKIYSRIYDCGNLVFEYIKKL